MKTLVSIVGARPQFVKLGILSKEIRKKFKEIIIHTGQHYDNNMSDDFFNLLKIPKPDYNLNVGSGLHGFQTGKMLILIEELLEKIKPNYVVNYGDTNSTIAGSLAAVKLHIPSGHIEAGLRNFDLKIPEEVNRVLTDRISNHLFAPTLTAIENLKKEGLVNNSNLVGDVMYDSLLYYIKECDKIFENLSINLNIKSKEYYFATIHRPNNTDDANTLKLIFKNMIESGKEFIIPLHPRTRNKITEFGINFNYKNFKLIEPVNYIESLALIKNAKKVITDSGGVQKEAYLLKTPCITIFQNTSWIETVNDGWNCLVSNKNYELLDAIFNFEPGVLHRNHYGDGNACEKIVEIINNFLN